MSVIKKYSATSWYCASCIQLQKLIDTLDEEVSSQIESVDIDTVSRQDLAALKIRGVPMLIAFDEDGKELDRLTGVPNSDALLKFTGKYLN